MAKNRTILSAVENSSFIRVAGTIIVFIVLLVLLVSRNTQGIADRLFWTDEVYIFQTVIQPFWVIPKWTINGYHMQPPLFYWIGHFVAMIGTDPLTLRSISLVMYVLMIGFVFFGLRELLLATRIFLCFILIMSPFAAYAATEFKAYAFAALSILVSSVLFYRVLRKPSGWSSAVSYGAAALVLQLSLTLNCFAFGLQMAFLGGSILLSCRKEGVKQTLAEYKPLIMISVPLCIAYAVLLLWIRQTGINLFPAAPQFNLANYVKALLENTKLLKEEIVLIRSWAISFAPACCLLGCIAGLRRNKMVTAYLIILLGGQLLFSTFMTFSRIDWLSERYLVASYVAFALLCALGAEYLFQRMDRKTTILVMGCLLLTTLPGGVISFAASVKTPGVNPLTEAVEAMRCSDRPTVIVNDPLYDSIVPGYAYRNDPLIIVPYSDMKTLHNDKSDPTGKISQLASEKYCFILMERSKHKRYNGNINKILSTLPGYSQKRYTITPGLNIPDYAWLYTPLKL
jgi:hypothetical protein